MIDPYLLEIHSPFSKNISWAPSFIDTAGTAPGAIFMLSVVMFNESSKLEIFGIDSDFLLGGFLGVLNEDLENRGIFSLAVLFLFADSACGDK